MKNWRNAVVNPTVSILDSIKILNDAALQILLVVDVDDLFVGTVTDGDIRRGILNAVATDQPISMIMNSKAQIAKLEDSKSEMLERMTRTRFKHLPIVDASGGLVGLTILEELLETPLSKKNSVVLMAGGLGSRLRPLTEEAPKPMLKVGERPLLETIIKTFADQGFLNFYISVNYKSNILKDFFGDGNAWGVNIKYLEEDIRLGTAGALSLIEDPGQDPMIVMNADLLTKVNFDKLLDFHNESASNATMCVREYDFEVPYGVVEIEDSNITRINEKPVHTFFVNAGIYILDPDMLNHIEPQKFQDMPHLFEKISDLDYKTTAFPVTEYWLDIGSLRDYEQANKDFSVQFD